MDGLRLITPPSLFQPTSEGDDAPPSVRVIWSPLTGSQELVLACPCNEILYEGTRGPGKTDVQLMKFRRYVGLGYGRHWRGIIFDREYKNLDDLVSKSMRWFPQFGDGARFLSSTADYRWVWPTGEELLFRQFKKTADYWKYHGHEFPYIGWNELTKYPTSEPYDMMKSCNRTSFVAAENPIYDEDSPRPRFLPDIPQIVMATANPYGAGHHWVRARFIDTADPGVVRRIRTNVYNPRNGQREDVIKTVVRIFGSYKENRYLTPEYVAELENMSDPNKRKAWLWGDWDIVAGGALSDLWGPHNVLPRFRIPAGWYIDRSFDWGSSHPFSVGWWAVANGEEVLLPDGRTKICPPRGSLIRCHEWYGTEQIGTNKGLLMSAKNVAVGIKRIEAELLEKKWIAGKVNPGPADNQIADVRDSGTLSIKTIMAEQGVVWRDSDKSAGSRKNGLQLFRDRLEAVKENKGEAGIYFMNHCRASLSTLPILPRDEDDPDDVDTDAEDHVYDEVRYRVLAAPRTVKVGKLPI